ncbi:MAG: hypothetical protein J6X55_10720 [Victivallales bacterium]|nr:hypothetical protein [Victivallales bacterium]
MSDNNTDISVCIDRIEEIKNSLVSYMNVFQARLNDCYDMLHNAPNDDLNRLITAGFVPGARFIFDGELFITFVGYTEFLRMDFLDEKKRHIYTDVKPTAERIDRFKKVEDKREVTDEQ